MELLKQNAFAKLVNQHPSRISLLIKTGKLKTKVIGDVTFVINNAANIKAATKKNKA